MKLEDLKAKDLAPQWFTEESLKTVSGGYLVDDETPRDMYRRVAVTAAKTLKMPEMEHVIFEAMWKGWLGPATPILCNLGTDRGLPISCYANHLGDSVDSIYTKLHEFAMLSKHGGGVGHYFGDIRGRGSKIRGNGVSEGIIPWAKSYDAAVLAVSQGSTRRGANAIYGEIRHPDAHELISMRRPTGDPNRRCLNSHHSVCIPDEFMESMLAGNPKDRALWVELLKTRVETGEPYIFFTDNVNRQNPQMYKDLGLKVKTSNICTEITLFTDENHTFVCDLASINLYKLDEFINYTFSNGMTLPEVSIYLLDAVMTEFIEKASKLPGFESAVRFAEKGRPLGLGVMGWHAYLQSKMIPMESFQASMENARIFRWIQEQSKKASQSLAQIFGEPEWCVGYGVRNTHLNAVAPTVSNSAITNAGSSGIAPSDSNAYAFKSSKGTFIRKNNDLTKLLESKGKNTQDVWDQIIKDQGSVINLKFLSEEEKGVFRTAREINQFTLVTLAAQRQKYIDQGQSLNLYFASNASAQYIHDVHVEAWRQGLKTLYYFKSQSVLRGDLATRSKDECLACHG